MPWLNALHGRALQLSRNPADAADLVQETYLRAFRNFSSFTEGTNCRAWLFTILYSVFVNHYRRTQRAPETVPLDGEDESFQRALADENWERDFTALTQAGLDWQGEEVRAALARLAEEFRAAVLLVDVDGLPYEEAAAALECPVGTLRSRLSRARKMLFLELRDYALKHGFLRNENA